MKRGFPTRRSRSNRHDAPNRGKRLDRRRSVGVPPGPPSRASGATRPGLRRGWRGASHLAGDAAEDAVDETARLRGRQQLRQLDGLVEGDRGGHLRPGDQLVAGHPQQVAVEQRHALDGPVLRGPADALVELAPEPLDAADQLDGVGVERVPSGVVEVALEDLGDRLLEEVGLVEDVEGAATGGGASPYRTVAAGAHCTRVRYAPLRVSTLMRSPVSTNSGTWTTASPSTATWS